MFITNILDFPKEHLYVCGKRMSEKLIKQGFCLLGRNEKKYYFYETEELMNYLTKSGVKQK